MTRQIETQNDRIPQTKHTIITISVVSSKEDKVVSIIEKMKQSLSDAGIKKVHVKMILK